MDLQLVSDYACLIGRLRAAAVKTVQSRCFRVEFDARNSGCRVGHRLLRPHFGACRERPMRAEGAQVLQYRYRPSGPDAQACFPLVRPPTTDLRRLKTFKPRAARFFFGSAAPAALSGPLLAHLRAPRASPGRRRPRPALRPGKAM